MCRVSNGGDGNDYVPASKCYCAYGLGGEGCDQRVVSYASLIWQVKKWPISRDILLGL